MNLFTKRGAIKQEPTGTKQCRIMRARLKRRNSKTSRQQAARAITRSVLSEHDA